MCDEEESECSELTGKVKNLWEIDKDSKNCKVNKITQSCKITACGFPSNAKSQQNGEKEERLYLI